MVQTALGNIFHGQKCQDQRPSPHPSPVDLVAAQVDLDKHAHLCGVLRKFQYHRYHCYKHIPDFRHARYMPSIFLGRLYTRLLGETYGKDAGLP